MPHAVFRCDATATLGIGHVVRCSALAAELRLLGWTCHFAVSAESVSAAGGFLSGFGVIALATTGSDEVDELERAQPGGCDLLVIDHYGRDRAFETRCRRFARRILVVDDLADRPHDADLLLDQSHGRGADSYSSLAPGCTFLMGPRFALLRRPFRARRAASLHRRRMAGDTLGRVLVAFGGTDPAELTIPVLHVLAGKEFDIDILTSSANPRLDAIQAEASRCGTKTRLHVDCEDVPALMGECDLAISAGGGTTWELACLGVPMLLATVAENQRDVVRSLVAAGAARELGGVSNLAATLADLAGPAVLSEMSRRSAMLCDGAGTVRVACALAGFEADAHGRPCRLDAATLDDIDAVFRWQAAPGNRRHARNPEPPTRDEHEQWYRSCLADDDRLLTIIMVADEPSGVVRLDRLGDASLEVSILLDPAYQGAGVGRAALRLARRLASGRRLVAEILPGNHVSRRLFQSVGYRQFSDTLYESLPETAAKVTS